MIKECKQEFTCGASEVVGPLRICMECHGYVAMDASTDYESLDRAEKQVAYGLWAAAQPFESKPERRLRRNHMKSKWILRHSQIRGAAKKRGKYAPPPVMTKSLSARRQRQSDRLLAALAVA